MTATAQKKRGEFSPVGTTVKECKGCGEEFTRNLRESQTQFRWRAHCKEECKARGRRAHKEYIVGEVRFLVGTDSAENLAKRLGYSMVGVLNILEQMEERKLAEAFKASSHDKAYPCPGCGRTIVHSKADKHSCGPSWGRR